MADELEIRIKSSADSSGAKKAQSDVRDVGDAVEDAGSKAKRASFDFKEFAANAGLGATAILGAGAGVAVAALKSAGQFEQQQIAFTTLLGDAKKAQDAIAKIEVDAKATPFNLPNLIQANQLLISAGVSSDQARGDIKNLGDAISATGGGTPELMRLVANLQQIKAVGKASAQDIKQFGMAGIDIYGMLADTMGLSVEQVKDMDIGYTQLSEAFSKAAGAGGRFEGAMADQAQSLQGVISNVQDAIGIGLKDIAVNSGLFDAVKDAVMRFLEVLNIAIPKITEFFQFIAGNQQALVILAGIVGGLLVAAVVGLVAAFGPMILAALAFAAAGAAIAAGIQFLLPYFPMIRDAVMPVFEAIAATITNFVETHMPLFQAFWDTIKGIFLFSLGFIQAYFTTTWSSMLQFLKGIWEIITGVLRIGLGVLTVLFGVFQGIFTGDWNKAWTTIKLGFQDIWEGIKSFLKGILDAIIGMVKGAVNSVIGLINGMIGGFNKIAGSLPGSEGVSIPLIPALEDGALNFRGGVALVGERGPELVEIPRGANVIPNDQLGSAGSQTVNQTNYIYSSVDLDAMYRDLAFAVTTR